MPLPKPYPPTEIDYQDWDDLAATHAGAGDHYDAPPDGGHHAPLNSLGTLSATMV